MPKKFLSKVVWILISVLRLNTSSDLQKSLSMINRQIINLSTFNFWRLELLGNVIIAIVKDINLEVAGK
jgi:hypothetical protein